LPRRPNRHFDYDVHARRPIFFPLRVRISPKRF
jgi:hypothetical protein